nr:hypothetical protein [Tanacetum cinerariifolium]
MKRKISKTLPRRRPNVLVLRPSEVQKETNGPRIAASKPATVIPEASPHVEKEVVDLSGNTRVSTPPVTSLIRSLPIRVAGTNRLEQDNKGLVNKLALHEGDHSGCESKEKELMDMLKDLERERDEWRTTVSNQVEQIREKLALSADLAQAEADCQRIVQEFIPVVVKRLHTSLKYRQSLAAPVTLCFTAGWLGYPYVAKYVNSYLFPMVDLLQVSPDVSTSPPVAKTEDPVVSRTDDTTPKSPPPVQENADDVSFGTTT